MRASGKWIVSSLLMISDAGFLYGIFHLAVLIRKLMTPLIGRPLMMETLGPMLQSVIVLGLGIFLLQGLYPGFGLTAVKELELTSKAVSLVFFLLAGVSFLNKPFQIFSRSVLLIAWIFALVMLPLARLAIKNFLSRFQWYGIPVVVFGDGEWAVQVANSLRNVPRLGWRPEVLMPIQKIEQHKAIEKKVELVIVAASNDASLESYVRSISRQYRRVIMVRQADYFGSLWIQTRDLDGKLGLEYSYHLLSKGAIRLKRLIDVVGALLLMVMLSPLFILASLLILIDLPGPVFHRQQRLGQNRQIFYMLKFRTMVPNAEEALAQLLEANPAAQAEYEEFHKLENDPRITGVGKWLRRFSLDEFPQLWNVFLGDMSLVGPRPYLASELNEMGAYAAIIMRVKPGMTGWWQVLGRHATTFKRRLQMDEYYMSNWSLWLDVYILMKTLVVVLTGKGA